MLEVERHHVIPLMEEHPEILESIGTLMANRRRELHTNSQQRAERRRRAPIGRMQRLFNIANDSR